MRKRYIKLDEKKTLVTFQLSLNYHITSIKNKNK